jgi:hypothetical protein
MMQLSRAARLSRHLFMTALGASIAMSACSSPFETCTAHRNCMTDTGGSAGQGADANGGEAQAGESEPGEVGGLGGGGGANGGGGADSDAGHAPTAIAGHAPTAMGGSAPEVSAGASGVGGDAATGGRDTVTGGAGGEAGIPSSGGAGASAGCTKSSECESSEFCDEGTCLKRRGRGQLCEKAEECSSNLCGGRCCDAGEPCTCPQPGAENLLKNPGFDNNLSGWTQDPGPGSFTWHTGDAGLDTDYDATSCVFSGGALLSNATDDDTFPQRLWQCIPVARNKTYNYGGRLRTAAECDLQLYPSANCSGEAQDVGVLNWLNTDWSERSGQIDSANGVSVRFSCYSFSGGVGGIDNVYVSLAPNKY